MDPAIALERAILAPVAARRREGRGDGARGRVGQELGAGRRGGVVGARAAPRVGRAAEDVAPGRGRRGRVRDDPVVAAVDGPERVVEEAQGLDEGHPGLGRRRVGVQGAAGVDEAVRAGRGLSREFGD